MDKVEYCPVYSQHYVNRCSQCVTDTSLCIGCNENPKYKDYPKFSLFSAYIPTCPEGYKDCVYDPAYIKLYHPQVYKSNWGDKTPEQVSKEICGDINYSHLCYDYDTEDK